MMDRQEKSLIVKPATILFLIFIFTVLILLPNFTMYWFMIGIGFFLNFIINRKRVFTWGIPFFAIYFFMGFVNKYHYMEGNWLGALNVIISIYIAIFPLILLSIAMNGYTTTVILNTLRSFGLPNNVAISVAVFFRFVPDYFDYYRSIKEGLLVRGISPSILRPVRTLEVYLVPMINKAFKTSEVISSSLLTKGIEYDTKKTFFRDIKLSLFDFVLIFVGIFMLVINLWMKFF